MRHTLAITADTRIDAVIGSALGGGRRRNLPTATIACKDEDEASAARAYGFGKTQRRLIPKPVEPLAESGQTRGIDLV